MENNNGKELTEFLCPDCWTKFSLPLGDDPSLRMVEFAKKVRCEPCGTMRERYGAAEGCAKKALRNAETIAGRIKQQTKEGEDNLVPMQKEELWKNKEKLQANLVVYRNMKDKLQRIAAEFKARTGMRIK